MACAELENGLLSFLKEVPERKLNNKDCAEVDFVLRFSTAVILSCNNESFLAKSLRDDTVLTKNIVAPRLCSAKDLQSSLDTVERAKASEVAPSSGLLCFFMQNTLGTKMVGVATTVVKIRKEEIEIDDKLKELCRITDELLTNDDIARPFSDIASSPLGQSPGYNIII